MPPRNHKNWLAQPNIESISSTAYNSPEIFAQEQEQIFSKVWVPMCHKSEMPSAGNFRTTQIAGVNVIAVEDLTDYPSILGGRVKTLHPKVFGGILTAKMLDSESCANIRLRTNSRKQGDVVIVKEKKLLWIADHF